MKLIFFTFSVLLSLLGLACGGPEPSTQEEVWIRLSRTFCYGRCPVYTVEVNAHGEVRYFGEKYVKVLGEENWQVPPADVQALKAALVRADFLNLTQGDVDSCPTRVTDHSSAQLEVRFGEQSNKIDHYHGCSGKPIYGQLSTLERQVDRFLQTADRVEVDWNSEPYRSQLKEEARVKRIERAEIYEFAALEVLESKYRHEPPSFQQKEELLLLGGMTESSSRLVLLTYWISTEEIDTLKSNRAKILAWAEENGYESMRVWCNGQPEYAVQSDRGEPLDSMSINQLKEYLNRAAF